MKKENTKKILNSLMVAAAVIVLGSVDTLAADVRVIANSNLNADAISVRELKSVFLEEQGWLDNGTHVAPVLQKSGSVHQAFLKQYLGQDEDALQMYYRTLVFSGRGLMPKVLGSDAEVVAYVAQTRGAIGYVRLGVSTEGVKILTVTDATRVVERKLISRIEPEYPSTLKRLHIGGTVRVEVTISPKGAVEKVELIGGNPILAETTIAAVKKWVYVSGNARTVGEVSIPFDPDR